MKSTDLTQQKERSLKTLSFLVGLYPLAFQERHGEEMKEHYHQTISQAAKHGDSLILSEHFLGLLLELPASLSTEWWHHLVYKTTSTQERVAISIEYSKKPSLVWAILACIYFYIGPQLSSFTYFLAFPGVDSASTLVFWLPIVIWWISLGVATFRFTKRLFIGFLALIPLPLILLGYSTLFPVGIYGFLDDSFFALAFIIQYFSVFFIFKHPERFKRKDLSAVSAKDSESYTTFTKTRRNRRLITFGVVFGLILFANGIAYGVDQAVEVTPIEPLLMYGAGQSRMYLMTSIEDIAPKDRGEKITDYINSPAALPVPQDVQKEVSTRYVSSKKALEILDSVALRSWDFDPTISMERPNDFAATLSMQVVSLHGLATNNAEDIHLVFSCLQKYLSAQGKLEFDYFSGTKLLARQLEQYQLISASFTQEERQEIVAILTKLPDLHRAYSAAIAHEYQVQTTWDSTLDFYKTLRYMPYVFMPNTTHARAAKFFKAAQERMLAACTPEDAVAQLSIQDGSGFMEYKVSTILTPNSIGNWMTSDRVPPSADTYRINGKRNLCRAEAKLNEVLKS